MHPITTIYLLYPSPGEGIYDREDFSILQRLDDIRGEDDIIIATFYSAFVAINVGKPKCVDPDKYKVE